MSELLPLATYNLNLQPFNPVPAIEDDFPVTIRITLAALDPEAADDKAEPSTLRILKKSNDFLDDMDDLADLEAEEASDKEDELDDDEEEEEKKPKKSNGKKKVQEEEEEEDDDEEDEDDEDEEEDEEDGDISEFVVCTLSPKTQYQQTLDLTITPSEEVYFVVTGSYPIHLTGNYVQHPDDEDSEEEDYDEDYDDDEYNLTPDEDEIIYGAPLDDDEIDEDDSEEEEEDSTPKIEEIEEEIVVEESKPAKKRAAEEEESKKSKKAKKNEKKEEKKSVQFTKELEQGPTGSTLVEKKADKKADKKDKKAEKNGDKKFPTKTLLGGVVTEDRKVGSGPLAKSGSRVGIRYIGKLKNGQVFDKNTSGKPFTFKLGKGECIKGFDLGVTGMAVGGERRVIIPPKMGYGSQALPGIPANSELTFDIKLVSLK